MVNVMRVYFTYSEFPESGLWLAEHGIEVHSAPNLEVAKDRLTIKWEAEIIRRGMNISSVDILFQSAEFQDCYMKCQLERLAKWYRDESEKLRGVGLKVLGPGEHKGKDGSWWLVPDKPVYAAKIKARK